MLKLINIKASYRKDTPVLKGVNLDIPKGQVYGILGMNGAGKTTLFNTIYGFINLEEGQIKLNDNRINHTNISFLETQNYFYPYMKGIEYLNLVTKGSYNIKLNNVFELPLNDLVDNYSTGMKKKLAFWGIFELNNDVIILDEPFNGVDIESVECFYTLILELRNRGKVIIISSHVIETLTRICDKIGYLNNGKIEKTYTKENYSKLQIDIQQIIQDKLDRAFLSDEEKPAENRVG